MGMGNCTLKTKIIYREPLLMEYVPVKEDSLKLTEAIMREISLVMKQMATESFKVLMELNMKVNGNLISQMG